MDVAVDIFPLLNLNDAAPRLDGLHPPVPPITPHSTFDALSLGAILRSIYSHHTSSYQAVFRTHMIEALLAAKRPCTFPVTLVTVPNVPWPMTASVTHLSTGPWEIGGKTEFFLEVWLAAVVAGYTGAGRMLAGCGVAES